jgi:imidazolonepropionase-like amidohydrolase
MKRVRFQVGTLIPVLAFAACSYESPVPPSVAITQVTVIDGTGAAPRPNQTVVTEGGRIVALGVTDDVDIPRDALVVDGAGKYLIPGLWDMHVHISNLGGPAILPLFTAYGVTGIRDAGSADSIFLWRDQVAQGIRVGPRIVAAGARLVGDAPWADLPGVESVRSVEEARAAVAARKARAQYVKVQHSFMARDIWLAVADEAARQGLPLVGHVPMALSIEEAIAHGLKGIEHTLGLPTAFTDEGDRLRARAMAADPDRQWPLSLEVDYLALPTVDDERLQAVGELMARNGVVLAPSLTDTRAMATATSGIWNDDPRMAYLPQNIRAAWIGRSDGEFDSAGTKHLEAAYRTMPGIVARLHRIGVTILAGTDAGALFDFPGSDLHSELAHLVAAGLTPMEALQTATRNPATFLGLADSLGTIEVGKLADLVLLDGDPLVDIGNTERIAAVIQAGHLFDRQALDSLLTNLMEQHR